jgi:hypothetical protein
MALLAMAALGGVGASGLTRRIVEPDRPAAPRLNQRAASPAARKSENRSVDSSILSLATIFLNKSSHLSQLRSR